MQVIFAIRHHANEGQKFVIALRINDQNQSSTTTMYPIQMDYNINFKNFSKRYRTSSTPVNPSFNVETFDCLGMKVFDFEKNCNFIKNGKIDVTIQGKICV